MKKIKLYKKTYEKLDNKELENDIYRIVRIRERKFRDLYTVKCIKNKDQTVLVRDEEIKEKWKDYFNRLYNGSFAQNFGDLTI